MSPLRSSGRILEGQNGLTQATALVSLALVERGAGIHLLIELWTPSIKTLTLLGGEYRTVVVR